MNRLLKKISPGRLIALSFAAVILVGTLLLLLPVSRKPDAQVSFTDALFGRNAYQNHLRFTGCDLYMM